VEDALESISYDAAGLGQVSVLEWARLGGCQFPSAEEIFAAAAFAGHLHVLKWVEAKTLEWYSNTLAGLAAAGGRIHVVKWIHNIGCEISNVASLRDGSCHARVDEGAQSTL
jgi:hypothetical protein